MKKLFTSTLLTIAAVPFLMAAPKAKKAQNQPASSQAQSTTAKPKAHKKHVKANKSANAGAGNTAASSTPEQ